MDNYISPKNWNSSQYWGTHVYWYELAKVNHSIDALHKALKLKPDFPEAYCLLGSIQAFWGKHQAAIEAFNNALHYYPDMAAAYLGLGITYSKIREYDKAIEFIEKSITISPEDIKLKEHLEKVNLDKEKWLKQLELYQQHEKEYSKRLQKLDDLLKLHPQEFEKLIANLYEKMGYETILTPATGDEGKDIILKKDEKTIIVECKNHNDTIGREVLQKLYGECIKFKADKCICVSTKGFKPTAIKWAKSASLMELVDGDEILSLMGE